MRTVKFVFSLFVLLAFAGLNGAMGQWNTSGTNIYNSNTGNVGIGNSAPTTLLHVAKNMTEPQITVQNLGGFGGATYTMIDNASGANWKFKATLTGGFKIRDHANLMDVITIEPNSMANAIYIDAYGQIAMRQNTPDGHGLNVINYTTGKAAVQGADKNGGTLYATGMLGVLAGGEMGLPLSVTNIGVLGIKLNIGNNGAAVYGWNSDANSMNYGGIFIADGASSSKTNLGVYASVMHSSQNMAGNFVGRVAVTGHPTATEAVDFETDLFVSAVTHSENTDTRAIYGVSQPYEGYGIGVEGLGKYIGVRGNASSTTYTGSTYGVYGNNSGSAGDRYGIFGYSYGSGTGSRIGVYGYAGGGQTNWAGYFAGDCYVSSDLRIATTTQATGYALSVNGKIACEEVLVEDMGSWPDYVFAEDYKLMSLAELEKSIEQNFHLPGLPSAAEIEENGLSLGDMQKRMIEKIEELTLYTIEQGKMISELQQKMETLEKENAKLRNRTK